MVEDSGLATRMLADLANEIRVEKPIPHVAELIYCLTRSWYNRMRPLPPTPQETLLFVVGVGLEAMLLKPHRQQQTGVVDGVTYAADFISYDEVPGELKTTRMGTKKIPDDFPDGWRKQVLSYMKGLGATEMVLGVLHLMGNYHPPFPELRCWRITATQEEIDGNWAWVLQRRDTYMQHIRSGRAPRQFTFNEPYECDNCAYKLLCDAMQATEELAAR